MGESRSERIRVVLIDDHPLVRNGVKTLLEKEPDIEVIAEAGNYAAILEVLQRDDVDVVLLDIQMPDVSGLTVAQQFVAERPDVRIIVLSAFLNYTMLQALRKSGISGYLLKDSEGLDLASSIRIVAGGGTVFDKRAADLEQGSGTESPTHADLTPRELEALYLVGKGMTNQEIGDAMNVSLNTVKSLIAEIMRKLSCRNRVEVVLVAQENHLI